MATIEERIISLEEKAIDHEIRIKRLEPIVTTPKWHIAMQLPITDDKSCRVFPYAPAQRGTNGNAYDLYFKDESWSGASQYRAGGALSSKQTTAPFGCVIRNPHTMEFWGYKHEWLGSPRMPYLTVWKWIDGTWTKLLTESNPQGEDIAVAVGPDRDYIMYSRMHPYPERKLGVRAAGQDGRLFTPPVPVIFDGVNYAAEQVYSGIPFYVDGHLYVAINVLFKYTRRVVGYIYKSNGSIQSFNTQPYIFSSKIRGIDYKQCYLIPTVIDGKVVVSTIVNEQNHETDDGQFYPTTPYKTFVFEMNVPDFKRLFP